MKNLLQEEFEKQKRELTQSLKYASYIQQALLPAPDLLARYFPKHFMIYLPRDIVSGDFYWVARKKQFTYVAVGDCTGHGVPGAFLSILAISFLNQIVARFETIEAAAVLNILREYFMKSLRQTGTEHEQKDGIDMTIILIDTEKNKLQYSGAFNPLYLIRKNGNLEEGAADKMPIGVAAETETTFTNTEFDFNEGDMIYLFSDGYVDQFGGESGKKFKYRPFRNLLQDIHNQPVEIQKERLEETFRNWRGEIPQLDDVTILGIRF